MIDEKSIIPKSADDSTYVQMFYKAYHKLLYREARKYLNSTEDIDDIVQDSVVKLIENLDTIRSLSPNRQVSYAVTVTRNLAINLLIRQKRITLESLDELEPCSANSRFRQLQIFGNGGNRRPTNTVFVGAIGEVDVHRNRSVGQVHTVQFRKIMHIVSSCTGGAEMPHPFSLCFERCFLRHRYWFQCFLGW